MHVQKKSSKPQTNLLNIKIYLILLFACHSCHKVCDTELNSLFSEPCSEEFVTTDSIKKCYKNISGKRYLFEYYKNDTVKTINEFKFDVDKNIILHGIEKEFYSNGALASECLYNNNMLSGPVKFYYKNGNIKNEGEYYNNKIINVSKVYYEDGILQFYTIRDKDGNTQYFREYNISGKMVKEEGDGIAYAIFNINPTSVKVNDTLICKYFVASPPETNVTFKILDNQNQYKNLKIVNNFATFITSYKISGKYEISGILEISDTQGTSRDTIRHDIVVK